MLWLSVTLLALFASVQGRAVNISNTWVLPEEGFPVFYRYFRDRISWYEADAVCQFHHANLVTVDTTAQYDAVRAYLKELDISSAVWVGLIRSNPDGDFTWTDYRGLSGDGYWSSAPDARAAPLCAAAAPAADYRWEARACGGPTVASFICELPVPQWALGNDGCMVRALPALTALYLPESAAVQLTTDCGLAGVKRVQCTGNVKREELLKDLSCHDEDDPSSTISITSTSTMSPATETTFNDQEVTNDDFSTTGNVLNEETSTSSTPTPKTETSTANNFHTATDISASPKTNLNIHNFIEIPINKAINLEQIHSNDIPQPEHQEKGINNHHLKAIEDNKSYHHRLLHDEMTRLGNSETIFTQPTDHFVPPLVMAKARISDDMTVLSLEEKHAQQVAEQRLYKHNKLIERVSITPSATSSIPSSTLTPTILVEEQIPTEISTLKSSTKKELKSSVPKKYISKYNIKPKSWKIADHKLQKASKIDLTSTSPLSLTKEKETITTKLQTEFQNNSEEDSRIDLTVIIKEPGTDNGQQIFYSNHTKTLLRDEQVANLTDTTTEQPDIKSITTEVPTLTTNPITERSEEKSQGTFTVTLNHEVIKITVFNDSNNGESSSPVVFEVSTLIPLFHNSSGEGIPTSMQTSNNNTTLLTISKNSVTSTTVPVTNSLSTQTQQVALENERHSTLVFTSSNNIETDKENVSTTGSLITTHEIPTKTANASQHLSTTALTMTNVNFTSNITTIVNTTAATNTIKEVVTTDRMDIFNHTDNFEEDHDHEEHEAEVIDDYQSPLLSAANEPLHRPNRSRRPLPPPNRMNKFNPFRILG